MASPCSKWVFVFIFHIRFFVFSFFYSCTSSSLLCSKREAAKLSILKRNIEEKKRENVETSNNFTWTRSNCRKMFFFSCVLWLSSVYFVFLSSFFLQLDHFKVIFLHINYTWHDTFCWHRNLFSKFLDEMVVTKLCVFNSISEHRKKEKTVTTFAAWR